MHKSFLFATFVVVLGVPFRALANEVANGDFENPPAQQGGFAFFDPIHQGMPNWVVSGDQGTDILSNEPAVGSFLYPSNGTQICYINDGHRTTAITQDVILSAGPQTLTFDQGTYTNPGSVIVSVLDGAFNPIFTPVQFDVAYNPVLAGAFLGQNLTFSTPSAGTYKLRFTSVDPTSAIIDNVDLEPTAAPEPASLAILVGAIGLVARRRRNSR
jgi:hypothetical protein